MKLLYALIHHRGTTPLGLYDDPTLAAADFVDRERKFDPEVNTAVVSGEGTTVPLKTPQVAAALETSAVTGRNLTIWLYEANSCPPC